MEFLRRGIVNWSNNGYEILYFLERKFILFINYSRILEYISQIDHNFAVLLCLSFLIFILLWYLVLRKVRNKEIKIPTLRLISSIVPGDDKPRFRKRDKIRYYATRLNRKFQDLTKKLHNIKSKDQKQKLMSLFAKKILNLQEQGPKLLKRTLPDTFLEPEIEEDNSNHPEEFQLILDSIKVFGHLDKRFLLEICKSIETIKLDSGQFLFKKGDIDDNVFVVKNGKIKVFIDDGESSMTIHEVQRGENIHSLLSVLDVITGNIQPYKSVQAVAMMPSEVLRLSAHSFLTMFKQSPQGMVRIIQLIAMRLHRVTFLCLHNYLGLSSELMSKINLALPDSKVVEINKVVPEIINKSIIQKITPDLDVHDPLQIKVSNYRKSRKHTFLKRSDYVKKSPEIGLSTSYKFSSLPLFDNDTNEVLSFSLDHLEREVIEGIELELGETSNLNSSIPSLYKKGINKDDDEIYVKHHETSWTTSLNDDSPNNDQVFMTNLNNGNTLLMAAKEDIAKLFGLPNISNLSNLKISLVPAGTWLIKEGEEDTDVYFVVSGELHVLQHTVGNDPTKLTSLFIAHPGELCGISTVISTEPNYYSVKAIKDARVVSISREFLYSLIKDNPNILLHLSNILVRRMSPFLRQIDFALEWTSIKAGYSLYKTGDIAKSVYIILNGRFRQICIKSDGSREIVNELGRGELCGFVEVLSDQPRATTIMAIRDSELAQIPSGLLSWIKRKAPHVVTRLIQLLADKLLVSMSDQSSIVKGPVGTMANLRTVAVVASSEDVPLDSFIFELQHAMMRIGSSVRLTSSIIVKRLGLKALDSINEYRLSSWLSQQEDQHKMIFYVCDSHPNSVWTRRCIRQADCVLVVALASNESRLGFIEQGIESDQTKVSKILVLLYPNEIDYPRMGKTSEWLNIRPWVTQHYHIRCPKRMFMQKKGERLVRMYKRIFEKEIPNPHSDMSRLARYITGTTIGLVLGGGGARGCSHVGAIRAMYESGIPIDIIGGTSIGALIAGLWAEETRITQFTQRARAFSKDMSSVWKLILDLTYSPVSMFSGRAMNAMIEKLFKGRQIEDLWIPFFCVTTDITNSKMRVHTNGSLWRFVRASMSLSGYLPPLCHPEDGSLLLDGGYVNNLPADVMRDMGAEIIFAIDVGSQDSTNLTNYGDWLSGWRLLYNKFITRTPMKVLNLTEIQSRLAYVSCVRQMEQVKASGICEYMRPPIYHYKTLQFGSFDEIQDVGYKYTKEKILQWQIDDTLKPFACAQLKWLNSQRDYIVDQSSSYGLRTMRNIRPTSLNIKEYVLGSSSLDIKQRHFIDLAELVSRIGQEDNLYESESDDFLVKGLTKIKLVDKSDNADEILVRIKDPKSFRKHQIKNYTVNEDLSPDMNIDGNFNYQDNVDGARKLTPSPIYPRTECKDDEGYDEDLEDMENAVDIASDPENFYRVLISSRKRKHRRSSLNPLHKSVTFDRSI